MATEENSKQKKSYYLPDYQVTIKASSAQEAVEIYNSKKSKKKKDK